MRIFVRDGMEESFESLRVQLFAELDSVVHREDIEKVGDGGVGQLVDDRLRRFGRQLDEDIRGEVGFEAEENLANLLGFQALEGLGDILGVDADDFGLELRPIFVERKRT